MMKSLLRSSLLVFFILTFFIGKSQLITFSSDSLVRALNIKVKSYPYLVMVLPTTDCYKCRAPLTQIVEQFKHDKVVFDTSRSFLITDNYVFAKDFIEENEVLINIKVQKNISEHFSPDGKSAIFLLLNRDSGYKYYLDDLEARHIKTLARLFAKKASVGKKTFSFKDSIFSKNSFQTIFLNGNVAFFDPILQRGAFTKSDSTLGYVRPSLSNYDKLTSFTTSSDTLGYELVTKERATRLIKITKLPIIHINGFSQHGDSIYCFFTANRYMVRPGNDSNVIVNPHNFLAIKHVRTAAAFFSMFDIASYDNYISFELFSLGGFEYFPVHLSPMFMTEKVTDNGLWVRMQKVSGTSEENSVLAFVKLSDSVPKIIAIDTSLTIEDRFLIIQKDGEGQIICSIDKNAKNKNGIVFTADRLLLSETKGFSYLYNGYKDADGLYNIIFSTKEGYLNLAEIDIRYGRINSISKMPETNNKTTDDVICSKNSILTIRKEMTDPDYNIGVIYLSSIPKTELKLHNRNPD